MLIAAILYLVMSIVTFIVYWLDKRAAVKGRDRVPERVLHALELFGGWPGALVAQPLLKHKSRKWRFWVVTWLIAVLHVVVWIGIAYVYFSGENTSVA